MQHTGISTAGNNRQEGELAGAAADVGSAEDSLNLPLAHAGLHLRQQLCKTGAGNLAGAAQLHHLLIALHQAHLCQQGIQALGAGIRV